VALLFVATVVLPSLALAVLAYRALESDRQLAEQAWRERMQDTVRRAYSDFEHRVLEIRSRAEALGRGEALAPKTITGTAEVVVSPEFQLSPARAFAWVPDGKLPSGPTLPRELEEAENREFRQPGAQNSERSRAQQA
jgi:hypothetical protein